MPGYREGRLDYLYRTKYGLSLEEALQLLASQEFKCRICGVTGQLAENDFGIDHDHQTGQVRGVLCRQCNLGLGYFRDDPSSLARAIAYLEESKKGI